MGKKNFLSSFNGKYEVFITYLIAGIFIPPALAFAGVYFLAKRYEEEPRLLDQKMAAFFLILAGHLLIIGSLAGLKYPGNAYSVGNILKVSLFGSLAATAFIYPLVYAWVRYDYLKYKKRIRGFRDTRVGKFLARIRISSERKKQDTRKKTKKGKKIKITKISKKKR